MPEKRKEIVIPEEKPALFPLEILEGQDTEIITTERKPNLFALELPQTKNIELMRKQFLFIGEWNPSEDPLKIGEQNFSVLENYRYTDFGLEGVNGYTKINTTALTTYLKGRSGIQLRTPYAITSFVLIQGEKTDFSESAVKENRTPIPSQGDFQGGTLHEDAAGAGLGRFSHYPQGHLAYCNEKETCIYAGDESRIAGFFTLIVATYSATDDITFSRTASPDTIVTAAGNFRTSGFKVGHRIIVTTTSGKNDGQYEIISISADGKTISLEEDILHEDEAAGAAGTVTITVNEKRDYSQAVDYTEALNNAINSAAQAASITGAATTAGFRGLVLSTRALKGVKFYIRTANDTASTTTFKYWNGDSFEAVTTPSDGTVSAGKSMAQTGTFSFDSTVATAKPLHFEGLYLYAYLFELSAGSADIYQVTVDAPFQNLVDIWDGVYRTPVQFQVGRGLSTVGGITITGAGTITTVFIPGYGDDYTEAQLSSQADYEAIEIGAEIVANGITRTVTQKIGGAGTTWYIVVNDITNWIPGGPHAFTYTNPAGTATAEYNDYTMDVLVPSYTEYPLGAVLDELTAEEHIIIGFDERMSAIWFEMVAALLNTNSVRIQSIAYWDGVQYTTPPVICDTTMGPAGGSSVGKSFNRSGLVSWEPPPEENEFRQTLFGVNAYFYQITVDGTLSGTWDDTVKEVVIDTVKGIPAQRTVKGYKFPAHYRNRPLLCGFVDGKEGNRVDYGMANTTSVFNGEDSSFGSRGPLYFGGSEDLTAYCEIYNRFGSAIYTTGIFTKATETYILTGYDVTTWQIHQISSIVGCPASETMDTAEVGYDLGAEAVRNIAIWLSYMGPVIFDAGVLVPTIGKKIKCYFDKADDRCINYAAIDKSHGKVDPDNMEYNLWIPSGSGQTTCNVWLCLDLVRKKWFVKIPAGSDVYPQAAFRVMDDYGAEYLYGLRDNGHMMRLEHGTDWDGNAIAQKVASADLIPTGNMFDYTEIRRLKLACISTTEDVSVTIKHYKDGAASSTTLTALDADGSNRHTRATQNLNLQGWSHRLEFSVSTSSETKGVRLLGWNMQFKIIREDN